MAIRSRLHDTIMGVMAHIEFADTSAVDSDRSSALERFSGNKVLAGFVHHKKYLLFTK